MKPIDVLTTAFLALEDEQIGRLVAYADSGKEFLCGRRGLCWELDGLQ